MGWGWVGFFLWCWGRLAGWQQGRCGVGGGGKAQLWARGLTSRGAEAQFQPQPHLPHAPSLRAQARASCCRGGALGFATSCTATWGARCVRRGGRAGGAHGPGGGEWLTRAGGWGGAGARWRHCSLQRCRLNPPPAARWACMQVKIARILAILPPTARLEAYSGSGTLPGPPRPPPRGGAERPPSRGAERPPRTAKG